MATVRTLSSDKATGCKGGIINMCTKIKSVLPHAKIGQFFRGTPPFQTMPEISDNQSHNRQKCLFDADYEIFKSNPQLAPPETSSHPSAAPSSPHQGPSGCLEELFPNFEYSIMCKQ